MSEDVTVLIVEDDKGIRELFHRYLRRDGFAVLEASNGEQMLDCLKRDSVDLILLDYTLPGQNAEYYIDKLKNAEQEIPFIIVTGSGTEEIAVRMMKEGAKDYIVKDQSLIYELSSRVQKVWKDLCLERQLEEVKGNLQFKNALLSSVNDLSLDAILVTTNEDKIIYTNKRFDDLWGASVFKVGESIDYFLDKIQGKLVNYNEFLTSCANVQSNMTPIDNMHEDLQLTDGKVLELYSSPMLDEGESLGRIWYFRDVTLKREAELEMLSAQKKAEENAKSKAEFLATFSHEVKNPISNIRGFLDLMAMEPTSESQALFMENMRAGCDSFEKLVQSILDISRLEAGAVKVKPEFASLELACEDTVMSFLWQEKEGLRIFLDISEDFECHFDAVLLRQVLTNLLSNALKFTDAGHVCLRVKRVEEGILFSVEDTGKGIDDDRQDAIFRAFEQETVVTAREYGGTGLGLAISAHLVRLMGGELKVESELDKGSKFYFTLALN